MTGMFQYVDTVMKEVEKGRRILVEIDGIPCYATKAEVIEAVKEYKTVKRLKG